MNIILFTSATNTSGGSRQALYLASGMAGRGHSVLFFIPEHSLLPKLAPNEPFWRYLNPKKSWRRQIESALPDSGPCVLHAFHNAAVKQVSWWGLFWRKRVAVAAHRGVIFRPKNPLPYWSPGIDAFLVNSRACARVLRSMGVSEKRLFYVPNAVPDSRIAPRAASAALRTSLGISRDALLFFCIGGNKPNKGVRILMHAFARAFPPDSCSSTPLPHLLVIGLAPSIWQPAAQALNLLDRIHCLEKNEDIGSFLAASTVFVLPSLSESMPNTLIEAVRAGLPCIGTDVGAVPDILTGAEPHCGLVVPPGDVPALARAMKLLADEPVARQKLASGSRAQGTIYTPEKRLDLVEGIYTELLRNKGLF